MATHKKKEWLHQARKAIAGLLMLGIMALAPDVSQARSAGSPPEGGFSIPLACGELRPCIIQFYMDRDAGPGITDYRCGGVTYDGHKGTDFRIRHETEMRAGVAVLAAASGRVVKARDGLDDVRSEVPADGTDPEWIDGNSVVLDHGGAWQTRYNHLRKGSLQVKVGETIERGSVLGQIGLSGLTNFPHLHFEVIHKGRAVDPFSGLRFQNKCGHQGHSLWDSAADGRLVYKEGGLLDAAFSSRPLLAPDIRSGPARLRHATRETARLLFWATAWSLKPGDWDRIAIVGPGGELLAESNQTLVERQDDWVRFISVPRPAGGWPNGTYQGVFEVKRNLGGRESIVIDAIRFIAIQ